MRLKRRKPVFRFLLGFDVLDMFMKFVARGPSGVVRVNIGSSFLVAFFLFPFIQLNIIIALLYSFTANNGHRFVILHGFPFEALSSFILGIESLNKDLFPGSSWFSSFRFSGRSLMNDFLQYFQ